MILSNDLERHGYARVLLASIHDGEFTMPEGCRHQVAWDGNALMDLREEVEKTDFNVVLVDELVSSEFTRLFPNLWERYTEGYDYADYNAGAEGCDVTLHIYQGDLEQLTDLWDSMRKGAAEDWFNDGGDVTYDYWPSEFGVFVAFSNDLDRLAETEEHTNAARAIWDYHVDRLSKEIARGMPPLNIAARSEAFGEEVTPRP